jgi:hypothetical protein
MIAILGGIPADRIAASMGPSSQGLGGAGLCLCPRRADRCCTYVQQMTEIEACFSEIPIDFNHIILL